MAGVGVDTMKPKVAVSATVRLDAYAVIAEAVEGGVRLGWNRAHKHMETPGEALIQEHITDAVLLHLTEVLVFDD